MNRKVKLLRLLALALLKIEQAVCAVSYRVGEYTLSTLADNLAEEEDALYQAWLDVTPGDTATAHWRKRLLDRQTEDNTELYNNLADELELEGA